MSNFFIYAIACGTIVWVKNILNLASRILLVLSIVQGHRELCRENVTLWLSEGDYSPPLPSYT